MYVIGPHMEACSKFWNRIISCWIYFSENGLLDVIAVNLQDVVLRSKFQQRVVFNTFVVEILLVQLEYNKKDQVGLHNNFGLSFSNPISMTASALNFTYNNFFARTFVILGSYSPMLVVLITQL